MAKKKIEQEGPDFPLQKENYILLIIGFAIIMIGFLLMITAVLATAISVVREKERGTMEQLRVAPLRTGELIVGKTLPYLAISFMARSE